MANAQVKLSQAKTPQQMTALIKAENERLATLSVEELQAERGRTCEHCGSPIAPKWMQVDTSLSQAGGLWVWPRCHCAESRAASAQSEEAKARAAKKCIADARSEAIQRAGLGGKLEGYTFSAFKNRLDWTGGTEGEGDKKHTWPGCDEVFSRVRAYACALSSGTLKRKWLILWGDYGMGKSHLAAAVLWAALERGDTQVRFRDWTYWLQRIQATWDKRNNGNDDEFEAETENDIINELRKGSLVAIDDLDKRAASEWVRGTLYSIINYRYVNDMPTILTFNIPLASREILDYIGRAVLDRIIENAFDVIEFRGESYRLL